MNKKRLEEQLITDKGLCLRPYKCPAGKMTIGIGRNIEDNGISEDEARLMLQNDIERTIAELQNNCSCFGGLNAVRQEVLVNMCFNLGWPTLSKFKKMGAALMSEDYESATKEMLDSKWARQVGKRAQRLAEQMRDGVY